MTQKTNENEIWEEKHLRIKDFGDAFSTYEKAL
jgi:hypothetical protein